MLSNKAQQRSNIKHNNIPNAGNMNLAYFELARQLKDSKRIDVVKGNFSSSSNEPVGKKEITSIKSIKSIKTVKLTKAPKENFDLQEGKDSELKELKEQREVKEMNQVGGTSKTTKESSVHSMKLRSTSMSNFARIENEFETPEELHYFYVNLSQNNKKLAYKFEQNPVDVSENQSYTNE